MSYHISRSNQLQQRRQLVDEVEPANTYDERDEFTTLGDEWTQMVNMKTKIIY
jgi:hypothetical protein